MKIFRGTAACLAAAALRARGFAVFETLQQDGWVALAAEKPGGEARA